ncbi:MAG: response regulator transcription factor [Anaerolineae bacterium]|nr:response regulator transcription factor [Anaerolineae bacterium]
MTMARTAAIRIVIVDDHSIVREGLRSLLDGPDMFVVGEGTCGHEAIELAHTLQPDVMLLDIRMRNGDGLECLSRICAASPHTNVIILTTYANPSYLTRAIQGGAAGFLSKETEPEEIERAIRAVAQGERTQFQSPRAAGIPALDSEQTLIEYLSNREREVLQLLVQGRSNADIADELHVSVTTVKTHIHHILEKLQVEDRTQAVLWAVSNGFID